MKEAILGDTIQKHAEAMVQEARREGGDVHSTFNGIPIVAHHDSDPGEIVADYMEKSERRAEEYRRSPEYKRRQEEAKRREEERAAKLEQALANAPEEPTWKDVDAWEKAVVLNRDPYGGAAITYSMRWARAMEGAIISGTKLEDCAEELSSVCDSEGITGFMYGCAVSILAQCWKHGEELRRWHNSKTQLGDEGDRANESGGVLNPALLGSD